MSKFVVGVFDRQGQCPNCSNLIRLSILPENNPCKCDNCNQVFWCLSPGYTERELVITDSYDAYVQNNATEREDS